MTIKPGDIKTEPIGGIDARAVLSARLGFIDRVETVEIITPAVEVDEEKGIIAFGDPGLSFTDREGREVVILNLIEDNAGSDRHRVKIYWTVDSGDVQAKALHIDEVGKLSREDQARAILASAGVVIS